jgi:tRNA (guanine-N7-)-methyltransferase
MEERVTPARPHRKLTEDGRRMREVLSYSRRGNRFTPSQAAGWEALGVETLIVGLGAVPFAVTDLDDLELVARALRG